MVGIEQVATLEPEIILWAFLRENRQRVVSVCVAHTIACSSFRNWANALNAMSPMSRIGCVPLVGFIGVVK